MSVESLSVDLWLRIFEEVLTTSRECGEGCRGVTVLLRVSRGWKVCDRPWSFFNDLSDD
jgi:hypothetical protein